MNLISYRQELKTDRFEKKLEALYGASAKQQVARYETLLSLFETTFPFCADEDVQISLYSAPGRTEIGGNHTDHQHGRVLAASVDMDMIAAAAPTGDGIIQVLSEGYPLCRIDTADLAVHEEEKNTTAALIRGVAAGFAARGAKVGGFCAAVSSSVLPGSGISSSAAFEVLIGNIINSLYFQEQADAIAIAQIGQYAENEYFGKPSGLMDQMASSVGNLLTIDFADPAAPIVTKLQVDFAKCGLALCIIDSGADHADLTDEYAAIPEECRAVARWFGKEVLRDVPKEDFLAKLPDIRPAVGDRALLRAFHFYADNDRVPKQAAALENGDTETFLRLVRDSGQSSWTYLQNILVCGSTRHQEMGVALAVCESLLAGRGAWRVHGGGFAGTVQAFVPLDLLATFREGVEHALGAGSCHVLSIRGVGGTKL